MIHIHPWAEKSCISLVTNSTLLEWYLSSVASTLFKNTWIIVARHIPGASHYIVDVLAKGRSVWTIFTAPETELIGAHEVLYTR